MLFKQFQVSQSWSFVLAILFGLIDLCLSFLGSISLISALVPLLLVHHAWKKQFYLTKDVFFLFSLAMGIESINCILAATISDLQVAYILILTFSIFCNWIYIILIQKLKGARTPFSKSFLQLAIVIFFGFIFPFFVAERIPESEMGLVMIRMVQMAILAYEGFLRKSMHIAISLFVFFYFLSAVFSIAAIYLARINHSYVYEYGFFFLSLLALTLGVEITLKKRVSAR